MLKYSFALALICLCSTISYAQQFAGKVIDSITQKPILNVQVLLVDYHQGTYTDDDGAFKFEGNFPQRLNLKVSLLGYESRFISVNQSTDYLVVNLFPQHLEIDEITVSGTKNQLQKYEITHIETRSVKDLQLMPSNNLGDALTQIPGVYNASSGNGVAKPVIRGFQGNRVVTMLNGIRVENQQWGGDHGMGLTELGIGSVEVIKGPASLLYGADALGGVIYFTDEAYAQQNTAMVRLSSQFESNTMGYANTIYFKGSTSKIRINAGIRYNSQADYQLAKRSFVKNSNYNDLSGKINLGWNKGKWIASVKYSFSQAKIGIIGETEDSIVTPQSFISSVQNRASELPLQRYSNHFASFENKFVFNKHLLEVTLGFTSNRLQEFEDTIAQAAMQLELINLPYTIKVHSELSKRWALNYGIQGMLQFQKNDEMAEERLIPNAQQSDNGIFLTSTFDLGKWRLQAGARADARIIESSADTISFPNALNKTYAGYNFSAGAVYNLRKQTIRLNISSGFRVPHLSELLSDGVHHGTLRYELGNLNLKTEKATQLDLTYEFQGEHISFIVNPFITQISNYTTLKSLDTLIEDYPAYQYVQESKAVLYGSDFGVHYHPHFAHFLHLESTFSVLRGQTIADDNLNFIPQPRWNNSLIFRFNMKSNFKITEFVSQINYNFPQNYAAQFETKSTDYTLIHLGLNFKWENERLPIEMQVGVRNLLNSNYIDHLSRLKTIGIGNPGRTFYVKLSADLNFKKS